MSRISRFSVAILVACVMALPICVSAQFSLDPGRSVPQGKRPAAKAQAQPPAEAQKRFANAMRLAQADKPDAAIAELQIVKKMMPKAPAVYANLGLCYMRKQDLGKAESAFRQTLALDPKNPAIMAQMTRVLTMRGKKAEALTYARKAAALSPKDPSTQFILGVAYLQNKDLKSAASVFKKVVAIDPKNQGALYNLSYCQINLMQYADARKTLERFLKLAPDNQQARLLAAMACQETKDTAGAIAHLEKIAFKDSPVAHTATMTLAHLYNTLKKSDKSIEVLKKAAAREKGNYDINLSLGRLLSGKQQYKEAEPYLLTAKQARSDAVVNMALALNSVSLGKLKEAHVQAETALKLKPKETEAIDVYAYVLDQEKKPDEAIAALRKWEQYYPKDATPNLKIAGRLQMQRKSDLALAEYEKAMKKKPNDVQLQIATASCMREANKLDDALKLLQKVASAEPKNQAPLSAMGEIYERQRKPDLAIAQYKKMLGIDTKNVNTYRRLAGVYHLNKDYKNEIEILRKQAKIEPTNVRTAMSIPRIYDEMGELDTAIAESKKVVDANPTNTDARQQYGGFLAKKKDYDGALAQYAELIKNTEPYIKGNGYCLTGGVQETQGKTDEALTSYKKCIEAVPEYSPALDAIGKIYETRKQNDEYYAYLKSLIEPGTDNLPYMYYEIAMKKVEKTDEATKTFEALAAKYPNSTPIRNALAQSYVDSGAKDKAIEQYKKLLESSKENVWAQSDIQRKLGNLHKDTGNLEEAAKCYDASLKAQGMFIDARLQKELGDLYVKLGKKTEALETYKAFLKSMPGEEEVSGYVKDLEAGKLPTLRDTPPPGVVRVESKPVEVKSDAKPAEPQPATQPQAKPADPQPAAKTDAPPATAAP